MYNKDVGMTMEETIQRYKPLVYDLAKTIYYRWYDIDDITQELYIKLVGAYQSYKKIDNSEFFTYLYRVLQNSVRNLIKHNKAYHRDALVTSLETVIFKSDHREITLEETLVSPDTQSQDYIQAIDNLYQMPNGWITVAWLNGWTYRELGDMTGKTFQWIAMLNKKNMEEIRRIFI